MADYAIWNAVRMAHDILDQAETVDIETYREAVRHLRLALRELQKRGRKV